MTPRSKATLRLAPKLMRTVRSSRPAASLKRALALSLGNRTAHPSFAERKGAVLSLRSAS